MKVERYEKIMSRVNEHYKDALEIYPANQICLVALQGSQNYELDIPGSDVDTKVLVVPSFKEVALNKAPVSTTHIRYNNEHFDAKDIRLYMETFRKQNLNFLEILFTKYYILNSEYAYEWNRLVQEREAIAHMNPHRAVKSMMGIAQQKYHAMEHPYPSKLDILAKYGYDPKQVHHLIRVRDYLERYIAGESYEKCLIPSEAYHELIVDIKLGKFTLDEARKLANEHMAWIDDAAKTYCDKVVAEEDPWCRGLLEDVSYNIMRISIKKELEV